MKGEMMIRYFQIKNQKGCKKKSLIFRERTKKYSKKLKETYVSKKKSLVITGLHAAGKSKELNKIFENKESIFRQEKFVRISATDSLSDWFINNIKKNDTKEFLESFNEEERAEIEEDLKKQHIKIQNLINKTSKAVLFIDDIDHLQGKKKEIVKDLIKVSSIVVCTAKNIQEIDKTIVSILDRKKYQEIALSSDQSYDATNILFVVMILGMLVTGNFELAALIMAGRYALKGKDTKK